MVRGLLNSNGFTAVKLIGYEHNWDDTTYPETVVSRFLVLLCLTQISTGVLSS